MTVNKHRIKFCVVENEEKQQILMKPRSTILSCYEYKFSATVILEQKWPEQKFPNFFV